VIDVFNRAWQDLVNINPIIYLLFLLTMFLIFRMGREDED